MFGVQLTERSVVCEKHYRPEDIITHKVLMDAPNNIIKTLVPGALPFATNTIPLETVAVAVDPIPTAVDPVPIAVDGATVLKITEGQFKRSRANDIEEHLSTKKVKNNLIGI